MEKPATNANIANEQSPVAVPPASWFLRSFAGVLTCRWTVSVCSLSSPCLRFVRFICFVSFVSFVRSADFTRFAQCRTLITIQRAALLHISRVAGDADSVAQYVKRE